MMLASPITQSAITVKPYMHSFEKEQPLILSDLPADIIALIALHSPLIALHAVIRFDIQAVAATRLQRWYRKRRGLTAPPAPYIGARVLFRRTYSTPVQVAKGFVKKRSTLHYGTIPARCGDSIWKVRLIDGSTYLQVPGASVKVLEDWKDGPWHEAMMRISVVRAATAARAASAVASRAASNAVDNRSSGTTSEVEVALAAAAASAAATAAAAATSAESAISAAPVDVAALADAIMEACDGSSCGEQASESALSASEMIRAGQVPELGQLAQEVAMDAEAASESAREQLLQADEFAASASRLTSSRRSESSGSASGTASNSVSSMLDSLDSSSSPANSLAVHTRRSAMSSRPSFNSIPEELVHAADAAVRAATEASAAVHAAGSFVDAELDSAMEGAQAAGNAARNLAAASKALAFSQLPTTSTELAPALHESEVSDVNDANNAVLHAVAEVAGAAMVESAAAIAALDAASVGGAGRADGEATDFDRAREIASAVHLAAEPLVAIVSTCGSLATSVRDDSLPASREQSLAGDDSEKHEF